MNLPPSRVSCLAGLFLTACGGGGGSSDPIADVPPELLACRARFDSPFQFAEVALRSSQNLGSNRIADRTGTERHARLHSDGNTVVFSRERSNNDPDSRELIVAVIDGSSPELRLTENSVLDDEPCWSPDGSRILFASERSGPKSLWLVDRDGSNSQPFLAPPAGESDGEPGEIGVHGLTSLKSGSSVSSENWSMVKTPLRPWIHSDTRKAPSA